MEKITPKCPYFGECGGCTAQHIPYEVQVENKKQLVLTHLKKNGIAELENIPTFFGNPYEYRNRMDFSMGTEGLSLRKRGQFNQFVAIKTCDISNSKINALMKEIQSWFEKNKSLIEPFLPKPRTGCMKYATIRASEHADSSAITFMLNEDSPNLGKHIELIKDFSKTTSAHTVAIASIPAQTEMSLSHDAFTVKGTLEMQEIIDGKTISFSSQGFFQNNTTMAEKMVQHAKDIFKKHSTKNARLIDLYGGAGTFGIPLGELFEKTVIIDTEGPNIVFAGGNLKRNNIKGETYAGDAKLLKKLPFPPNKDLYLLIDPPRSGMHQKVIQYILELKPKAIVYVSCNPMLMAKELKAFMKHYTVKSAAMFDLFPQTEHVEAIVHLERHSESHNL